MRRMRTGLGAFGKGFIAPPPAQPINVTVTAPEGQPTIVQGATSAEMAALRAEIEALRNQRQQVVAAVPTAGPQGVDQAALVANSGLVLPGTPTRGGEVVEGAGGRTEREVLSTPGQSFFTRTTDPVDANLRWDDWNRLKGLLPANFNEEKYLARHPDIAKAVQTGAMPSGAWHYVMYGMPSCQYHEKRPDIACEDRALAGWRRALNGLGEWLGLGGSRPQASRSRYAGLGGGRPQVRRPQARKAARPGYLAGHRLWK